MQHKTFELIETKAEPDGSFTALASVFGNVDHAGDRMMPGAFRKTLERWRLKGNPIPVILSHQWNDPHYVIGKAEPRAVFEDERGLVVQGILDLDNPVAKQTHKLMRDGLLTGWSFGYTVPKGGQKRSDGANEISEVDLIEVGPTLNGANPQARLEQIKSLLDGPDDDDDDELAAVEAETEEESGDDEVPIGEGEKAVWTAAYVNDLPDSCFLYVEPGGEKDDEGKTVPRSLRHFPVKDADGTVDLPHLRNALARIPQSNLSQTVKDRLTAMARRMLDAQTASAEAEAKAINVHDDPETGRVKLAADPLQAEIDLLRLDALAVRSTREKSA